jgi:hypothetical protein
VICPRCEFDNHDFAVECARCGVVFSKLERAEPPRAEAGFRQPDGLKPVLHSVLTTLGKYEIKILAFGAIAAAVAQFFWITRAALGALKTLFHEIGHALVAWLLGHPSIPAFDFMFGGGLTHYGEFHVSLALAIGAGILYLGWRLRRNTAAVTTIAVVFLVWLVIVTKAWRRETAMAAAGVVFELVLAAVFLYMAIAAVGWRAPEIERPLAVMIAFFMQFSSWIFALDLIRDSDFLEIYKQGKGGALMNDLEVIALNLRIYLGIEATIPGLAKLLLLFSFVPLSVAFWLALRHDRLEAAIESLVTESS